MAYPTAAGFPSHSGSYIPELYAKKVLIEFYAASIFMEIATTEYEEPLKNFGDTMIIRTLPEINSRPYVKGQKLVYDTPQGGRIDLLIDKGYSWNISLNDLDVKQMDLDHKNLWAQHAAKTQASQIDRDVLQNVYLDAHASNTGTAAGAISGNIGLGAAGAPRELDATNILQLVIDCGVVLDEQNAPEEGRWMVLPSWACSLLKMSDLKAVSTTGDAVSPIRNGKIGEIDRFTIYRSNNLATVKDTLTSDSSEYTGTEALFGHKSGIAFASQMTNTETLRNQDDFGDLMRSLQAFGYKVIKPEAVGHMHITKDEA